jgi:DNA-directed RNA polymerase specialized sigma24 family protein
MNFNQIVSEQFESKDLELFFKKIAEDWWDELRQDVFLIICNYDKDKILDLYQKKALKFFIIRIALNQFNSKTSKFYYQNKKNSFEAMDIYMMGNGDDDNLDTHMFQSGLYENQEEPEYLIKEEKLQLVENELESLRYFEREILKLYLQLGTYKKVSQDTGIPIRTVANAVKNGISNIKEKTI